MLGWHFVFVTFAGLVLLVNNCFAAQEPLFLDARDFLGRVCRIDKMVEHLMQAKEQEIPALEKQLLAEYTSMEERKNFFCGKVRENTLEGIIYCSISSCCLALATIGHLLKHHFGPSAKPALLIHLGLLRDFLMESYKIAAESLTAAQAGASEALAEHYIKSLLFMAVATVELAKSILSSYRLFIQELSTQQSALGLLVAKEHLSFFRERLSLLIRASNVAPIYKRAYGAVHSCTVTARIALQAAFDQFELQNKREGVGTPTAYQDLTKLETCFAQGIELAERAIDMAGANNEYAVGRAYFEVLLEEEFARRTSYLHGPGARG